jgi:1,4-alpha-glucan branching enzyme
MNRSARPAWTRSDVTGARWLAEARHPDPFGFLGVHRSHRGIVLRVFDPAAEQVAVDAGPALERIPKTELFVWRGARKELAGEYLLTITDRGGHTRREHDPYTFPPQVGDFDRQVFGEGRHWHAYRFLGANPHTFGGIDGVLFATWAPHAQRVSVVGDFNAWDGRRHPMRRHAGGIWELFLPGVATGSCYKFEIRAGNGAVFQKGDPYARQMELRPRTASVVANHTAHAWKDAEWMRSRESRDWLHAPMSVYELHLGSWQRDPDGSFLNYREIGRRLVPYIKSSGFTHVELLPLMEHPFDGSWGYQTTGYFAPTRRFGEPDDLRALVDECHQNGIGVLLDWTPGHFPSDEHGLARFDGGALYEHPDPRQARHPDWGTLIYDYSRPEVRNFLLSSALYWLEEFHADGLRVDAVASMLYLDYSRAAGEWLPNRFGGRENLEAIQFLQHLNAVAHDRHPGAVIVAEESTAWPQVTRPTFAGGLGFSMKWNMGWMHDTLKYFAHDPVHRRHHHPLLTFGMLYAYSENFVLPLSHDEVVHGKRALLEKMPGDDWRKFAQLRLLYAWQWTYPGKKLLFMGQEFAQRREWNHDTALDWHLMHEPAHGGIQRLVADLNRLYTGNRALHYREFEPGGFQWIDCDDAPSSVLSFLRRDGEAFVVVAMNFTPVPRRDFRIGVPEPGRYHEVLNTDASIYGGSDMGNAGTVVAGRTPWNSQPCSVTVTLPPLAAIVLEPEHEPNG